MLPSTTRSKIPIIKNKITARRGNGLPVFNDQSEIAATNEKVARPKISKNSGRKNIMCGQGESNPRLVLGKDAY